MKPPKDEDSSFMGVMFAINKKPPSKTRKLPYLPRLGVYIDLAGYEITFKKVSFLETLANLVVRGGNAVNLAKVARKVAKEQLAEVEFPKWRRLRVVNTSARTISVETK